MHGPGFLRRRFLAALGLGALSALFTKAFSVAQTVGVQRWLELRQVTGSVSYRQGDTRRTGVVGDRLQAVGQGIVTGARSSAVLAVDDGIGFIQIAENTDLEVKTLQRTGSGGKITELRVLRGQARLNVRPFNNPESRLEIQTPAGVAAVRGTEFGVTVTSNGRSGISTRSGLVSVSAQDAAVPVGVNQFSTIVPGQSPTPARPIRLNTTLTVQSLVPQVTNQLLLSAVTEAPNLVWVNSQEIVVDDNGQIRALVTIPSDRRLVVLVRNPFGEDRTYLYTIP